jgi:CDGSH-type Zn-finger protein
MDEEQTVFKVIAGGPLKITGSFKIKVLGKAVVENKDTIYLCRCGGSSNKPYCDDTHQRNGFAD